MHTRAPFNDRILAYGVRQLPCLTKGDFGADFDGWKQGQIQEFAIGAVPLLSSPLSLRSRVPFKPAKGSGEH